ncbi:hypothetical protein AVEN_176551-1 [Araneus ventricosus]|uniref:Uncharacterized protein n=1 Tax=Araneus ventricosus TaxID=182803 RepID=A0A4Y2KVG8_ARAVE|nr:hypothetical protein AVEN_176551-1 [Araneus ventricosus]
MTAYKKVCKKPSSNYHSILNTKLIARDSRKLKLMRTTKRAYLWRRFREAFISACLLPTVIPAVGSLLGSRERGPPKNHREVSDFHSKSTDGSSGNPSKIPSIYYDQQSSNVSGNELHKPKEITPVQVSIQCHRQDHNL